MIVGVVDIVFFDKIMSDLVVCWIVQDKARKATGMQIDALQDGYVDNELFSLASIKVCHYNLIYYLICVF